MPQVGLQSACVSWPLLARAKPQARLQRPSTLESETLPSDFLFKLVLFGSRAAAYQIAAHFVGQQRQAELALKHLSCSSRRWSQKAFCRNAAAPTAQPCLRR